MTLQPPVFKPAPQSPLATARSFLYTCWPGQLEGPWRQRSTPRGAVLVWRQECPWRRLAYQHAVLDTHRSTLPWQHAAPLPITEMAQEAVRSCSQTVHALRAGLRVWEPLDAGSDRESAGISASRVQI